ncbi:MAG: hypothetical protein JW952_06055 [Candidatus Eisenbacteria bacterium]|nr:hypothetical protein [Candidatus Eisenbacteria bacterium]
MATSSSTDRAEARSSQNGPSRGTGRGGWAVVGSGVVFALLLAVLATVPPGQCAELAGGLAVPRGFYDYGVGAFGEFRLYKGTLPPYVSVNGRVSGYGSYMDQIGLVMGSASVLLRLSTPDPLGGTLGLKPYVSVGPSFNYQYSWADLDDFGTISESRASTTASVFVGVDFFSASNLSVFVETRETIRSDFTFDCVLFGLKYAGPTLPGIE